jgi:hypothetical protein
MPRWHVQVRTRDGAITSYVRVRADDISEAARRARFKAARRHRKDNVLEFGRHPLSSWVCIYAAVHTEDQDKL